jgi:glutamine synthetase
LKTIPKVLKLDDKFLLEFNENVRLIHLYTGEKMTQGKVSAAFGALTFNEKVMREKLSKSVFEHFKHCLETGQRLGVETADTIAHAMKEWALEQGATHYSHWFIPLTGTAAEKHECFLELEDGQPIERFTGKQLIQGEPDASSFPNGGIRSTFEARGYTAWDPSSPAFITKTAKSAILTIPSIFFSYNGEALDKKTPLLRSMKALSDASVRALSLFGGGEKWVQPVVGAEQEYFLVATDMINKRLDLRLCSRTLVGAAAPKDQQLEDHYFGSVDSQIVDFMQDLDDALHELGIPAKTRHNEVAPSQFEIASIHEVANIASDHNQLLMQVLMETARKHGLEAIVHEKPFAGINGNGKHCNWSLMDSNGNNLMDPGKTPRSNLKFLFFLTAVIRAVHDYEKLIRSSVATAGNDHRLGANEAPPAVMSIFLGAELTKILNEIRSNALGSEEVTMNLDSGVGVIPQVVQHTTDRNRTSPFAFTGNKFEFRAVGGAQSISLPLTFINVAVAHALDILTEEARACLASGQDVKEAILNVLKSSLEKTEKILFEGNNYSDEWLQEAERRGLSNLKNTADALVAWEEPASVKLCEKYQVLSEQELKARQLVRLHQYATKLEIEAQTLVRLVGNSILPPAMKQQTEILGGCAVIESMKTVLNMEQTELNEQLVYASQFASQVSRLINLKQQLEESIEKLGEMEHEHHKAKYCADVLLPKMNEVRESADIIERSLDFQRMILPTYSDLLFRKR